MVPLGVTLVGQSETWLGMQAVHRLSESWMKLVRGPVLGVRVRRLLHAARAASSWDFPYSRLHSPCRSSFRR